MIYKKVILYTSDGNEEWEIFPETGEDSFVLIKIRDINKKTEVEVAVSAEEIDEITSEVKRMLVQLKE